MEVESGSHWGQTILISACITSTKAPTVTTQLSLALQQVLRFNSVHPTLNHKENI